MEIKYIIIRDLLILGDIAQHGLINWEEECVLLIKSSTYTQRENQSELLEVRFYLLEFFNLFELV